jgi:hypothetical protein
MYLEALRQSVEIGSKLPVVARRHGGERFGSDLTFKTSLIVSRWIDA